ncbi:MAG TPA: MFS transporter [Acidimicrobiales bacterium]|nr:MFS transporter [Acidimicrobiales bacterium]
MADQAQAPPRRGSLGRVLWYRQLDHYPDTSRRVVYLGIVVLATIVLYYQLYVPGAVAPQILSHYHMSFRFYVDVIVVLNAIGAFTSVLAGLADRWGRANLVAYGLGVTALLTLFAIPNAPNEWTFAIAISAVGFVEGIVLVATPALVRDFSPQLGRASAMGFWTLGPVVGSLVVAEVASHTLSHLVAWEDQFVICGIVSVVIFLVALVGLRELSPRLRDQLMVSLRDRALVEARAKGIDVEASLRKPWRQVVRMDVVLSAVAISVLLLIYYTAVGFNPIYFETIFNFTASQANALGNWWWLANAIALVVIGAVSDRLRVRKPFMVVGAAGAVVVSIVYLSKATSPHTGYYTLAWIVALLAVFLAVAFAPWMASFTETVERRNPALTAHGLAVWGWIIRATVAISTFILPYVVSSTNALVQYGSLGKRALAIERADPTIKIVLAHPALFAQLQKYPTNKIPGPLLAKAVKEVGLKNLLTVAKDPHIRPEAAFFQAHASQLHQVLAATHSAPSEWQHWWWVCVAGEIVFIPLVLFMAGRWSPRAGKRDEAQHDISVQQELARLEARRAAPAAS